MNLRDALRAADQLRETHQGPSRPKQVGSDGADSVHLESAMPLSMSAPRHQPILPFLSVLVAGRDGSLAHDRGDFEPLGYHPSIGYARSIYLAIAINWVVDWLGLAYLFHGYLANLESAWLSVGVPIALGMVLSSGFANFAVGLVTKPLGRPSLTQTTKRMAGVVAGAMVVCTMILGAAFVWDPGEVNARSPLLEFAHWLSMGGVVVGIFALMALAWSVMDALFLGTRMVVMVVVGFLVAGPLHEAMFREEIEAAHRQLRETELRALAMTQRDDRRIADSAEFRACIANRGGTVDSNGQFVCRVTQDDIDRLDLHIDAAVLMRDSEKSGYPNWEARRRLAAQARSRGAEEAAALLQQEVSGRRGGGARYQEHVDRVEDLKDRRVDKLSEKARCAATLDACVATGGSQSGSDIDKAVVERIDAQLRALEVQQPGPIDRAKALDHLVRSSASGDLIEQRLLVAWVLALLMPLIVVVMKLTAGQRLEPYLQRRWKGQ